MISRKGHRKEWRSASGPAGTIRAAALLGFRRLVEDLEGDADALLTDAGIAPESLASPDNRISFAAMIELLERCAGTLRCADFGLRLSTRQNIDILGPAAMIAHHSDTVGESLRAIARYYFTHTSAGNIQLAAVDSQYTLLTYEILIPGLRARRQINELALGIAQNLLNLVVRLIGRDFCSSRVTFIHRKPADLAPLVRRFGRNLYFDEAVNAITVPNEVLMLPMPDANPEFRDVAIDYVRSHLGDPHYDPVKRIATLVRQLLPTGRCSLQAVARTLAIHPRRLQRELAGSGTDFRGIVDATRRELVADYLLHTDVSLAQIAAMLGYSDEAAFYNAFKRWYGLPPGRWCRIRSEE